jgi:predicted dehydrogenase
MRILIIGLGSIAKKHIYALRKVMPEVTIYALRSNLGSESIEGVINIYSLTEINSFDFAIISSPTSSHKKSLRKAISLNCPLIIEKPIFHNLEIQSEVEKIKHLNYVACNLRFLDSIRYLKTVLDSNSKVIQEINVYCGSYLPDWRPGKDYTKSYSANLGMGGGVHLDLIHEIDYIYWFCGLPNKVNSILKSNSSLNISSYDYANYCLEYNNFCVSIILNYYRKDPKRILEIIFDDCTWKIDLLKNRIICGQQIIFESQQNIQDTYELQLKYFLDLINKNESESFNSVKDGLNVLKICLNQ